jgi:hypothetical protein
MWAASIAPAVHSLTIWPVVGDHQGCKVEPGFLAHSTASRLVERLQGRVVGTLVENLTSMVVLSVEEIWPLSNSELSCSSRASSEGARRGGAGQGKRIFFDGVLHTISNKPRKLQQTIVQALCALRFSGRCRLLGVRN